MPLVAHAFEADSARGHRNVQPRRPRGSRCDRGVGYNTLQHRPALTKWTQLRLLGARTGLTRVLATPKDRSRASRIACEGTATASRREVIRRPARHMRQQTARSKFSSRFLRRMQPDRARVRAAIFISRFSGCRSDKAQRALRALRFHAAGGQCFGRARRPGIEAARAGALARGCWIDAVAGETSGHADSARARRYDRALQNSHALFPRFDSRRGNGFDGRRYATFDRLSEYCYRVAGTVGLTCLHVFGFSDPHAPDLAERLGLAFQLTNIIRDVRSRLRNGPRVPAAGRSRALRLPRGRFARPSSRNVARAARIRSGARLAIL